MFHGSHIFEYFPHHLAREGFCSISQLSIFPEVNPSCEVKILPLDLLKFAEMPEKVVAADEIFGRKVPNNEHFVFYWNPLSNLPKFSGHSGGLS